MLIVAIITLLVKSQIIKHTKIDSPPLAFFFFFCIYPLETGILAQLKQCKLDSVDFLLHIKTTCSEFAPAGVNRSIFSRTGLHIEV